MRRLFTKMDLSSSAQFWVNLILLWLGFGILVGLVAQAILPEGEPKSAFGVLVIGITGSCLGPLLISLVWNPEKFNPIGPLGFAASVPVSLAFFLIYRAVIAREGKQCGD